MSWVSCSLGCIENHERWQIGFGRVPRDALGPAQFENGEKKIWGRRTRTHIWFFKTIYVKSKIAKISTISVSTTTFVGPQCISNPLSRPRWFQTKYKVWPWVTLNDLDNEKWGIWALYCVKYRVSAYFSTFGNVTIENIGEKQYSHVTWNDLRRPWSRQPAIHIHTASPWVTITA